MSASDRPRFRVSADRQAASRRVRYVETNAPLDGNCSLCRLDEENPLPPGEPQHVRRDRRQRRELR